MANRQVWGRNIVDDVRETCWTNIAALAFTKDFKCSLVSDIQQRLCLADLTKGQIKLKQFFKPMFPPKNKWTNSALLLWNLRSTCFHSIFGGNWRHQKDILKLTDLTTQVEGVRTSSVIIPQVISLPWIMVWPITTLVVPY